MEYIAGTYRYRLGSYVYFTERVKEKKLKVNGSKVIVSLFYK